MPTKRSSASPDSDALVFGALSHSQGVLVHEGVSASTAFAPTGEVQTTSSGVSVVHLRQEYGRVPVLGAVRAVRFGPDGEATDFTGETVGVTEGTPVLPEFGVGAAVQAAFVELLEEERIPPHLTFTAAAPVIVAALPHPARPTVLRKPPFVEPVVAGLVVDASGKKARLAWEVRLALPDGGGGYVAVVTATRPGPRPRVLSLRRASAHAVSGPIYEFDPRVDPTDGLPFPQLRAWFPPVGGDVIEPQRWVAVDATEGDNARAVGPSGSPVRGHAVDGDVVFRPATAGDDDHRVVNAFYWCNVLHDFFLLLGFDEAAGNFQNENDPTVGGGDAVDVIVRSGLLGGLAFFQNRPDGTAPTLELGRFFDRHTALDADIVIHEYVHGITSRIIGGKDVHTPLEHPQSLALGEGYSDYWAITLQNWFRRKAGQDEEWIYGQWIAGRETGLRTASYEGYPNTYGFLRKSDMKPHIAGEVWCATLLEVNRALGGAGGDRNLGDVRGWQLVFDSLRFLHPGPRGPHFLHARDALLGAYDAAVQAGQLPADPALWHGVEEAFRVRGMGPGATSADAEFKSAKEAFS